MSIKEALKRESITLPRPAEQNQIEFFEHGLHTRSVGALIDSGALAIIKDLMDNEIRTKFPDVKYGGPSRPKSKHDTSDSPEGFHMLENGLAEIALEWNRVLNLREIGYGNFYRFNRVAVLGNPASQDILVRGELPFLITKSLWDGEKGREIVENVILESYRRPQVIPPLKS